MTEFSKILSYYVKERKTNISALATETKIERTLLHKYISGTRTPSDIKSVQTIAKSLMLSHDEKCRLTEAYKMTCMGEETYFQNKHTEKIINYLSGLPKPDIFEYHLKSEQLVSCAVNDRLSVQTTIKRILADITTTTVFVTAPPSDKFIYNELTAISLNRPDIRITQILSFGSSTDMYGKNLEIFALCLPLMIFCGEYTPLINYLHPSVREDTSQLMPNLILTPRYAFSFTNDLSYGILHTERDILFLYRELAVKTAQNSYELMCKKITSVPKETDAIIKVNKNLFIAKDTSCTSLIFERNSIFYRIMIYEQSLRNLFDKFISSLSHEQTVSDENDC